jgi:hypothetical protein
MPPVLPSTTGRQIRITPKLQESPHSPIEEVKTTTETPGRQGIQTPP